MKVLQTQNDACGNESDGFFSQSLVLGKFWRVLFYETVCITAVRTLHDEVHVVNILESHDEGDNESALEGGEDIFLEFGIFWYFFSYKNIFGDSFHGILFEDAFFGVLLELGLENDTETSFSEFTLDFEIFEADFLFGFGFDVDVFLYFLIDGLFGDFFDWGGIWTVWLLWFV